MYEVINQNAEAIRGTLVSARRDFHRYAESGWLEMRTTSIIIKRLTELGYEVLSGRDVCCEKARMGLPTVEALESHYAWALENGAEQPYVEATRGGFTGAIAILRCGEGPTVALRFDIDALGVVEDATTEHRPTREGFMSMVHGTMHACGHDGHAAIGLGVAELLMKYREKLCGTVKLIFQPAEEGVRGARSIVEKGHLDDVDYLLAGHIFPDDKACGCPIGVLKEDGEGGLATVKLDATIIGKSAHAGISPQLGKNAMLAAATAVLNLHAIPRYGSVPTHCNVGTLHAGSGRNVVCEEAVLELEVRGKTTEACGYMEECAHRVIECAAKMHGCTCKIQTVGSASALVCDDALSKRVQNVCAEKLGIRTAVLPVICGGSEDFAFMTERVQRHSGTATYFGIFTKCAAANHNDRFDFDEDALVIGVRAFTGVVFDLIGR